MKEDHTIIHLYVHTDRFVCSECFTHINISNRFPSTQTVCPLELSEGSEYESGTWLGASQASKQTRSLPLAQCIFSCKHIKALSICNVLTKTLVHSEGRPKYGKGWRMKVYSQPWSMHSMAIRLPMATETENHHSKAPYRIHRLHLFKQEKYDFFLSSFLDGYMVTF